MICARESSLSLFELSSQYGTPWVCVASHRSGCVLGEPKIPANEGRDDEL